MFTHFKAKLDTTAPGGFKLSEHHRALWSRIVSSHNGTDFYFYFAPVYPKDSSKMIWFFRNELVPRVMEKAGLYSPYETENLLIERFGFKNKALEVYTFPQMYHFVQSITNYFEL